MGEVKVISMRTCCLTVGGPDTNKPWINSTGRLQPVASEGFRKFSSHHFVFLSLAGRYVKWMHDCIWFLWWWFTLYPAWTLEGWGQENTSLFTDPHPNSLKTSCLSRPLSALLCLHVIYRPGWIELLQACSDYHYMMLTSSCWPHSTLTFKLDLCFCVELTPGTDPTLCTTWAFTPLRLSVSLCWL